MKRAETLATDEIYHVMNKSIAGYKIFYSQSDYRRMLEMIRFFSYGGSLPSFSHILRRYGNSYDDLVSGLRNTVDEKNRLVEIIAYCLMPTHVHVMVRQLQDNGISIFMGNILNSYARYFNVKRERRGPLWVGRFKAVRVSSDEQALHLTRYIHLNPTTAGLVKNPGDWEYSSYALFVSPKENNFPICKGWEDLIGMKPNDYRVFVEDHISYQKDLAVIKHVVLE